MKIGVFGGTFNPPHLGHLIVVESVQDQCCFDKILFVPSANPPHKIDSTIAPALTRLEMTKLATQNNPFFQVSDIEIRLSGTSYSVVTINALMGIYPKAFFSMIIGADNYLELDLWKSPEEIFLLADLIVMHRPGYHVTKTKSKFSRNAKFVKVPAIDISSTEIRRRVRCGRSIRYLVPPAVEQYIYDNDLYRR